MISEDNGGATPTQLKGEDTRYQSLIYTGDVIMMSYDVTGSICRDSQEMFRISATFDSTCTSDSVAVRIQMVKCVCMQSMKCLINTIC